MSQQYATGGNTEKMWAQREREIRDKRTSGLSLGYGVLPDRVVDYLLTLLDQTRAELTECQQRLAASEAVHDEYAELMGLDEGQV